MKTLRRYLEILRVQIKNNWVREAIYRTNFVTAVGVDIAWIIVEVSLFSIIYANVTTLAGWTKEQVYFFLGVFFASDALFTIFFQTNFFNFSDLIVKGDLDILLTKPVHPLFLALFRWINMTAIFNFIMGIGITIHYATPAGFEGGLRWAILPLWLGVGVMSAILVRFAFAVWIFWTDRNWALVRLYYQCFSFATKPDTIYPKFIRYAILTILPFGFIGSVPARALLTGLEHWEYGALLSVLVGFFFLDRLLWHKGLARYQSASS